MDVMERNRIAGIAGVSEAPSMFSDDLAFWVNGKEIAHIDAGTAADIRLTRVEIRATRDRLAGDPRVRRRAAGSDWVVVDCTTPAGMDLAVELAGIAARVHAPADGEPAKPPPDGARLRSLRRFHVPKESMTGTRDTVAAYWAAADARDWAAFGSLLADDVVYEVPQSRERVRGRAACVRFNAEFPGDWRITVQRLVADGQHGATWIRFTLDGVDQAGLCFFDLDGDGLISHISDFWPEPYDPPPGREHLVERF